MATRTLRTPNRVTGTNLETMLSVKWHKMAAIIPQVGARLLDARQEVLFLFFSIFAGGV